MDRRVRGDVLETILKLLVLTALLVAPPLLLTAEAEPEGAHSWSLSARRGVTLVAAAAWALVVRRRSVRRATYLAVMGGAALVFLTTSEELFGRRLFAVPAARSIDHLLIGGGLLTATIGLLLALRELRGAVEGLTERADEYRRQSITDNLTGLYNGRYLFQIINGEVRRAERYRRALSLLLVDIDDFKSFNDTYGHLAGDRLLEAAGAVLQGACRANDMAFRLGGEEFIILLPETTLREASVIADRVRKVMEGVSLTLPSGEVVGRTASVGASTLGEAIRSADDLIAQADSAMYRAKAMGKNRVSTAGSINIRNDGKYCLSLIND